MTEHIEVKHTFTDEERAEMQEKLYAVVREVKTVETEKSLKTAEFNTQLKTVRQTMFDLSERLEQGYEFRQIECEAILNEPEKGMKRMIDVLTGEVVRDMPMTDSDRQQSLFDDKE